MRLSDMIRVVEDHVVSTVNVVKLDCKAALTAIAANHAKAVVEEVKVEPVTEEAK